MTDHVLAKAKEEHQQITNKIKELQSRASELETFIRLYLTLGITSAAPENEAKPPEGKHAKVVEFATGLIRKSGPQKTLDLYSAARKAGIEIGTENPLSYLSVILSSSKKFNSSRAEGWSLKES